MLSHEQIWKAIDRLAEAHNYSTSGLARRAGLDPTTFNKSKRFSNDGKERWPSTESISKILAITQATLSEFISLVDDNAGKSDNSTRRFIPLAQMAQATKGELFNDKGHPTGTGWDEIPFPVATDTDHALLYALEIDDESMMPIYRPGDIVVVAPNAPTRRGDRVIVRTSTGEIMARELSRQTATRIALKTHAPQPVENEIATENIRWMARIIWVSQ